MKRACLKTNTYEQNHASSPDLSGEAIGPLKTNFVRMKKITTLLFIFLFGSGVFQIKAQASGSDNIKAFDPTHNMCLYEYDGTGIAKSVIWGGDLAWNWDRNFARCKLYMETLDVARLSHQPTHELDFGTNLTAAQIADLDARLGNLNYWGDAGTLVTMNCDHPSVDAWYTSGVNYDKNWAALIEATRAYIEADGHTVVSVAPFNEPDFTVAQGDVNDFYDICQELDANPEFDDIRISGGNTLNCSNALSWYNTLNAGRLDEGNTHQLAGTFNDFVTFFENVTGNGDWASLDEMHNVMEAMVGTHYGVNMGIWWGAAEHARGEFCKATRAGGAELGYSENRGNWTSASVHRAPDGQVQAFTGASERQAYTTTYRFISKDQPVFYDGYGPQHEYIMEQPGGTGYQVDQPNAERVIYVTQGEDIQPAIPDGNYIVVNRNSGLVMEVLFAVKDNDGGNVQQNTYSGGTNQQWTISRADPRGGSDFSYYEFTPVSKPTMTLNNEDDSFWYNGANVAQKTYSSYVDPKHWYLVYDGDGWFEIRNRTNTHVIEVGGASTATGANINLWPYSGATCQQWRILPVGTTVEFVDPTTPSDLTATAREESVELSWTASTDAGNTLSYNILRGTSSGGPYITITRNVTQTTFVDNTATLTDTYYYVVKAVDAALNSSAYSSEASATTTGAPVLVAQYLFENNAKDNTINLNHAAAYSAGTSYVAGYSSGRAIALNGTTGFVQIPAEAPHQQEITISTWVYWDGTAVGNQQRIFDFGNGGDEYMFLSPNSDGSGNMRFAITNGSFSSEQGLNVPQLTSGAWKHVAVTLGASGACVYVDGVLVGQNAGVTLSPLDIKPVMNYIGRSQWVGDSYFDGSIDDFRIYNYEMTATQIAALYSCPPKGYTTTGTYTVPAGVTQIYVECWGAGGGGGSASASTNEIGGGGGGAYAKKNTFTVTPGQVYYFTVSNTTAAGGTGVDTEFRSTDNTTVLVRAKGGLSVVANSNTGGAGGAEASCIGDVKYSGGNGGNGVNGAFSGGGGGGAGFLGAGGNANLGTAGTGMLALGGTGGAGRNTTGVGNTGTIYGGGGSGACRTTSGSSTGGAGSGGYVLVTPVFENYWLGTTSTNWGTAANWLLGSVPLSGEDVIFASTTNSYGSNPINNLILDADRTIGDLTNESTNGSALIIPTTKCLTVDGTITTLGDASQIVIQSASGVAGGSMIFPNSTPPQATVEMYSKAYITAGTEYHWQYFGVPLSSITASPTLDGSWVRYWDESLPDYDKWQAIYNGDILRKFKGYEIAQTAAKEYTFEGTLVNNDTTITLNKSAVPYYPGQHVLANPYTAAINIASITFGGDMESSVYVYNAGSYDEWDAVASDKSATVDGVPGSYLAVPSALATTLGYTQIPSMQGFVVRIDIGVGTPASGTVTIPYSSTEKTAQAQRVLQAPESFLRISVIDKDANMQDQMYLFSIPTASREFDNGYDGYKLTTDEMPISIYAKERIGNFQINTVNDINNTCLSIKTEENKTYSLKIFKSNLDTEYEHIYLVDMVEDKMVELEDQETEYEFNSRTSETIDRFMIVSERLAESREENVLFDIKYHTTGYYLQNLTDESGCLWVYDTSGRLLITTSFEAFTVKTLALPQTGVYLVQAQTANHIVTKKLMFNK